MMHESKTSAKMETLYDKLNNLAAEISEGIINLSGGRREEVQQQLSELREQAYKERSPEVVYNTVLFRRYAEIANQIKDSKEGRAEKATFIGELPSFVYESDDENVLVGLDAMKANIFRLRVLVVMFSLIAFSVMSAVPFINEADFYPAKHFHAGCKLDLTGQFNFRAYQLVIAVGVLAFLQNLGHLTYYVLPVDSDRQKYLPGGTSVLAMCFREPGSAELRANAIGTFFRVHWKFLEVLLDSMLLVMGAIAFVVSQFILESAVETHVHTTASPFVHTEYYTLSTCYETFSQQTPACLDDGLNPTSKIRGALAMLFFATLFQLLCFLMSLRTFRQDPGDGLFTVPFGLMGPPSNSNTAGNTSVPVGDSSTGHMESSTGAYGMRALASNEVPPGEDEEYGHRAGTKL